MAFPLENHPNPLQLLWFQQKLSERRNLSHVAQTDDSFTTMPDYELKSVHLLLRETKFQTIAGLRKWLSTAPHPLTPGQIERTPISTQPDFSPLLCQSCLDIHAEPCRELIETWCPSCRLIFYGPKCPNSSNHQNLIHNLVNLSL